MCAVRTSNKQNEKPHKVYEHSINEWIDCARFIRVTNLIDQNHTGPM